MKRFTLLIITLTLTILQIAAQDTSIKGIITLSHQGNETDFAYNEMTKVMDAAADGDTVFLSTGYFQGDFIMTRTTKDNVIVKDIPSYPGKYAASTDGRIYSIRRQ